MIAADTSTWIAFLAGDSGEDVELLEKALGDRQAVMIPVVLTELFSDPKLPREIAVNLLEMPSAELVPGYWERTGLLRARILRRGRRARVGDALIAQCCIDQDIPLITRDRDFKAFANAAGFRLLIPL